MTSQADSRAADAPDAANGSPVPPPATGAARYALADAVRDLADLVATAAVPSEVLADATDTLARLARDLDQSVGTTAALRSLGLVDTQAERRAADLHDVMLGDFVVGRCNPLAPPLRVSTDATTATMSGTFSARLQQPPGAVHVGILAAAFDIALAAANRLAGTTGPTVDLRVTQHRPTRPEVPITINAAVVSTSKRRVVSEGRLVQQGEVTASATGTFAILSLDEVRSLLARSRRHHDRPDRPR